MSKEKAIKLLDFAEKKYGGIQQYQIKSEEAFAFYDQVGEFFQIIAKAKRLLESEPEPTEFTKVRREEVHAISSLLSITDKSDFLSDSSFLTTVKKYADMVLEDCNEIDRLTAECGYFKAKLKAKDTAFREFIKAPLWRHVPNWVVIKSEEALKGGEE
jgi:hypothetical protein